MSIKQEARVLTLLLKNLARQGSSLLVSKPSMEQAGYFAQLTNAYLLPTGLTKLNVSVESTSTPEAVIDASMESIFSTIKGLLGIGEKIDKDKKDSEKAYFTDLYKKNLELKAKNSKAFQDKAWMSKAELNEGVISITGGHGDMFHRNQTSMKTASDVIKEFSKDLSVLRKSFGDFVKQCKPYLNWTKASWDKCEKAYEDFEDSMAGIFDDDDPKLEAKITTIVDGFLAKRPAVPSDAARTLPAGLLGSDKKPVRLELVAATKEEIAKVIELWETILEFTCDVMESEYELQGMGCGGDFTDYPWRCEAMQKAIYTNKNDFSTWTGYDTIDEFVYDPLQEFVEVIDNLEDALYHYIMASIKTKP